MSRSRPSRSRSAPLRRPLTYMHLALAIGTFALVATFGGDVIGVVLASMLGRPLDLAGGQRNAYLFAQLCYLLALLFALIDALTVLETRSRRRGSSLTADLRALFRRPPPGGGGTGRSSGGTTPPREGAGGGSGRLLGPGGGGRRR